MHLPTISGRTYAVIGGGVIAAAGCAGHVMGQTTSGGSGSRHADLATNMLLGAGVLGAANLGTLLLPTGPKMLLAVGAGALAGAAFTLGQSYGRSEHAPQ